MLRKLISILLLLLFIATTTAAVQHASGQTIKLGTDAYRGVNATAQLHQIPGGTAAAGKYLLTVSFSTKSGGKVLQKGDVAARISAANRRTTDPVRLNLIDGSFQSEIQLSTKGESLITVGSKLDDDKKRIFQFSYSR